MFRLFLLVVFTLPGVLSRKGFGPGEQDWGYVTVRDKAHMFWWLYFTTANVQNYTDRPLIVWLQGGPGASSTGYGNFAELGPLDLHLNERNYTWVKDVNVLFVDNPVGTGFSYVDNYDALATTNRQIATDFVELIRSFYLEHPEFVPVPFYIVSESYGGKMTIEIGLLLDQAIKEGTIKSNFIGVGLGDSWIDPVNTVLQWAPYLLSVGAIDNAGYNAIDEAAQRTKQFFDEGRYVESTSQFRATESVIKNYTANINFYNILTPIHSRRNLLMSPRRNIKHNDIIVDDAETKLATKLGMIMRQVKQALGLNISWVRSNSVLKSKLAKEIMKPVTNIVEEVLNTTNIKVAIYNGQLDLVVCTPGTVTWVDNLQWSGSADWAAASRPPIAVNGTYEGFEKEVGNLALFWVNRAGHMVPANNPAAMDYILRKLTQDYDGTVQRQ